MSRFSKPKKKKKVKKVRIVKNDATASEQVVVAADEQEAPGLISQIVTPLATQATVMLLTLAKEKLDEFMQSQTAKKESADDHS